MEEIFIVDRIENGYAVCETEQGEKKDILLSETKDVHEGDVLILKGGVYIQIRTKQKQEEKGYSPYRRICGLKATPYDAICLKNMLKGIDRNGKRFIYAYQ